MEIIFSLAPCLQSHIEQYNVFELLSNSGYDINSGLSLLDILARLIGVVLSRHGARTSLMQSRSVAFRPLKSQLGNI